MANYSAVRPTGQLNPANATETNAAPGKYSFPSTADSWDIVGTAPHTMQIYSSQTRYVKELMDWVDKYSVNNPDATLMEAVEAAKGLTGAVRDQAVDYFNSALANSDRNLLFERFNRLNNSSNRLTSVFTFYMPSPVIFPLDNDYEDWRMTEQLGGALGAFLTSALPVGVGSAINDASQAAGRASQIAGYPINPKVEILFRNLNQRKFQFEFRFHPASEAETRQLKAALIALRKDASPERAGPGGVFWKAPNTFDIKFMHRGVENTQIPRISECIIESLEIDYTSTPVGWTTFTNGHPVTTRVVMNIRELEPIDKANIGDPALGGRGF